MNVYDFKQIPPLTAVEKKSPYAKFYSEPVVDPSKEIVAALQPGKQMNPSLALPPQDLNKLFMPGALKADNGWCVMPDGTGYSVVHTKAPGITAEMEAFWSKWMASKEYNYLNFKAALPGKHFMFANPVWEDFGWGPVSAQVKSHLSPISASSLPKQLNPNFFKLYGMVLTIVPDFNGKPYWATMVHYITMDKKGEDIITLIWHGIHIFNDTAVRMLNKADRLDPEYVRKLACHDAWQAARKAQLLPKLYAYSKTLKK